MKSLNNPGAASARQSPSHATRVTLLGAAMLGTLFLGNVAAHAISTTVVISEVRFRGSAGASDELIELYNLSNAPVDISGYQIFGSSNTGTTGSRATVPANTTLQPGQHFLATGSAYNDGVTGDVTFGTGFTDTGGVALFLPDGTTLIDAVGLSTGSAYKEGTPLAPLGTTTAGNFDQSYERKPGGAAGNKIDTDDNSADFTSTASTPQNLASPVTPTVVGAQTNPSGTGTATPSSVDQGQSSLLTVTVTPGTNPASTGITVVADLSSIGGSATQAFASAGNNTYTFNATVPTATTPGSKTLPITITDAQSRTGSASIALTVNQVFAASTTVVISEFRSRGAGGGSGAIVATGDEFVELYNLSNADVDISGYTIRYSSATGSTSTIRATIGAGVTLPAGQHYLLAAATGPLEAQANTSFTPFIADTGGIGLFDAAGSRVDAVGLAQGTLLKEGTALASFPADNDAANRSYERLLLTVNNKDTQNNVNDFQLTSSNPQGLGANTSPKLINATYTGSVDSSFSQQLAGSDADAGETLAYSLTAGSTLPATLTLSSTGVISGTPTTAGRTDFAVNVTDGTATTTAKFIIVVSSAADGLGPVVTRPAFLASYTRDELAALSYTGTIKDVAQGTVTPTGVSRLLFQLRQGNTSYSGPTDGFTPNVGRGYYAAFLDTPTPNTTAGDRLFRRTFSTFIPPASVLTPGSYSIVIAAQDVAGNYSVEVVPVNIVAPNPTPSQSSAQSSAARMSPFGNAGSANGS